MRNTSLLLTGQELGEKVSWLGFNTFFPVSHHMGLLFPAFDGLFQFHLSFDDQHINNTNVCHIFVLPELLPQFFLTLLDAFWNIVVLN